MQSLGFMHTERQKRPLGSGRSVPEDLEPGVQKSAGRYSRSAQMINVLRQEFLYSEKRARDILFDEIEGILRQSETPIMLSRLTREAAARAQERGRNAGYDLSNWNTAAKATINAMLGAGVLLDQNGNPIPLTIAAPAAEAAGLVDRFQDRTEAYLLEVVIRKMGDLTARDHTALAHALFRQFDRAVPIEDLEDRVVMLLASLSERIALADGGTYSPAS
jgi:hypothetical protein